MDIFELFKPVRNKIRKLNLEISLEKLQILKSRKEILPEVSEFLYVNLILHAEGSKNLICDNKIFNEVLHSCNVLNREISASKIETKPWRWLHALMLSQLKAHYNGYLNSTYRYFFIFSDPKISHHIENQIGMPYKDYFMCALWLHAVFSKKWLLTKSYFTGKNNGGVSFSKENILKTLKILSYPLDELKSELSKKVKYDEDMFILHGYPHFTNPIFEKDGNLYCMFPDHLHTQLLGGMYYIAGIGDNENDLSNAFGKSFEKYVGVVLDKNNHDGTYEILEEIEFTPLKASKLKTSDWVIRTDDAIIFIECKTKRLRLSSKTLLSYTETLAEDINFMASAITQLYKVFNHYKRGHIPGLAFDHSKKFIPIVVTLEEWFAGGPDIKEKLTESVKSLLIKSNISPQIVDEHNFKTYSIDSFEIDIQLMFNLGFVQYIKKLALGEFNEEFRREFPFKEYYNKEFEEIFMKTPIVLVCNEDNGEKHF